MEFACFFKFATEKYSHVILLTSKTLSNSALLSHNAMLLFKLNGLNLSRFYGGPQLSHLYI